MKIRKNLEAVFLAASVLATFAAYATASVPALSAPKAVQVNTVSTQQMQVVTVTAKRLSAAEKAQLN
jgi:hypothetical protein